VINNSAENKSIPLVALDSKPWNKHRFNHYNLISCEKLVLQMSPKVNRSWGSAVNDAPPSAEKIN